MSVTPSPVAESTGLFRDPVVSVSAPVVLGVTGPFCRRRKIRWYPVAHGWTISPGCAAVPWQYGPAAQRKSRFGQLRIRHVLTEAARLVAVLLVCELRDCDMP
jgi:hypothetical protein